MCDWKLYVKSIVFMIAIDKTNRPVASVISTVMFLVGFVPNDPRRHGGLPSETRRKPLPGDSRLWLLLRSTESIPGLDHKRPVCEGLREQVPHIPASSNDFVRPLHESTELSGDMGG